MSDTLQPGARLGHYEVVRPLGSGGMGVVYVARDVRLGREVALKLLPRTQADEEHRQRFMREARAAAAVKHRSIAQVYDVDETDGQLWLAMELVEGETLAEVLSRGPLAPAQALALSQEIAAGLSRAHRAQVIHRDLKPGNVMIDRDGQVKLLDFGLARLQDEEVPTEGNRTATALTGKGRVMGTPGYMAPEQARGEVVDARADLFSLGVMLLEMLTGEQAFPGSNPMGRIVSTLRDEPVSIDRIGGALAPSVASLLKSLLSKNPAERPASADLVVQSLSQLSGTPMPAPSAPPPPSTAKTPATRNPRRLQVAGALAVLGVLTATVLWFRPRPEKLQPLPVPPKAAVGALFSDPASSVACLPFTVTGQVKAKEMGLVAGGTLCTQLAMWHWILTPTPRFLGPAALLKLPAHGDETFPEDPFSSAEAQAALSAAAAKQALVISGNIDVEDNATTVVVKVRSRDGAEFTLEKKGTGIMATLGDTTLALMEALSVPPGKLPEEDAAAIGVIDGRQMHAIAQLGTRPQSELSNTCEQVLKVSTIMAAESAAGCGHTGRTAKGNPDWPPGLDEALAQMPEYRRAYFQVKWGNPDTSEGLLKKAAILRAARKNFSPIMNSEYALREAIALLKADRLDEARTAFDVAIKEAPDNCEARQWSYPIARKPEFELRAVTAWCPYGMWGPRAQAMADQKRAIPMYEMHYYLTDRGADWLLSFGGALFHAGEYERLREIASFHLERNAEGDSEAAQYLLGLYDVGNGRYGAALSRHEGVVAAATRVSYAVLWHQQRADGTEELLGRPRKVCNAFLERFVIAEKPGMDPRMSPDDVANCLLSANPTTARKAISRMRERLARAELTRGPNTELVLSGYEKFLAGDAKGAAQLWRRRAADYGPMINAAIFVASGDLDLAEQRWRMMVSRLGARSGVSGANLAKALAKKGEWAEATALARTFIDTYSQSDVEIPGVAEMRALLKKAPPVK